MSRVTDSSLLLRGESGPPLGLNFFLVRKESQLWSDCRVLTGKVKGVWLTRNRGILCCGFSAILGFLFGPELEVVKQNIGHLAVTHQILASLAQCCRHCGLASRTGCCEVRVRVLLSQMVRPLSACVFNISLPIS